MVESEYIITAFFTLSPLANLCAPSVSPLTLAAQQGDQLEATLKALICGVGGGSAIAHINHKRAVFCFFKKCCKPSNANILHWFIGYWPISTVFFQSDAYIDASLKWYLGADCHMFIQSQEMEEVNVGRWKHIYALANTLVY